MGDKNLSYLGLAASILALSDTLSHRYTPTIRYVSATPKTDAQKRAKKHKQHMAKASRRRNRG